MEEAAAGKAWLPAVDSLTDGTMRRLVAAERSFRRPGTRTRKLILYEQKCTTYAVNVKSKYSQASK